MTLTSKSSKRSLKERLALASRLLAEYSHYDAQKKLDTYLTCLRPALAKLHTVVNLIGSEKYSKAELLNFDFLLADVRLIMYYSSEKVPNYIMHERAREEKYPSGIYEVLNKRTGKCKSDSGVEFFNARVAIDYTLESTCKKWTKEIDKISKIVNSL